MLRVGHARDGNELMVVVYRADSVPEADSMMYGRAFGGRVVHRLRADDWSATALCGYTPRSFLHWRERATNPSSFAEPLCKECAAKSPD